MATTPPANADQLIADLVASLDTDTLKALAEGNQEALQAAAEALDPPSMLDSLAGPLLPSARAFRQRSTRSAFKR